MNATLPAKLNALPDAWVSKIFGHMEVLYGSLFIDRWRDCDMAAIRRGWAEELASFSDNPECFGKALAALRDECRLPPTLPEFAAICKRKYEPPKVENLLPAPEPLDPEEAAKRAKAVSASVKKRDTYDYQLWAKKLRIRYQSGENIVQPVLEAAAGALGEVWEGGECRSAFGGVAA